MFSKRARFKVFEDHIKCGSWTINKDDIEALHCYHISLTLGRAGDGVCSVGESELTPLLEITDDPLSHRPGRWLH